MPATAYQTHFGSLDRLRKRRRADHRRQRQALRLLQLLRDRVARPSPTRRWCSARTRSTCSRRCAPKARRPGSPARTTSSRCAWTARSRSTSSSCGAEQTVPDAEHNGAVLVKGEPKGQKMGWLKIKRGHQALLPKNSAYQFRAAKPARGGAADLQGRPERRALGRDLPDSLITTLETHTMNAPADIAKVIASQPDATLGYRTSRSAASISAATSTSPTSPGPRATAGR